MRNIAVITGTRAEYGLLKNIMKAIDKDDKLNLQLVVTGSHLSPKLGMSISEILFDGFKPIETCPILMDYYGVDKNARELSNVINEFAKVFKRIKPDIILILGDRYEILGAAVTALTMNIPIAHISGGEITEGASDNQIRHSITKMAHIHFPGAYVYGENIIKMGEEPWRVFYVGDPGIENIKMTKLLEKYELEKNLGLKISDETLLVTYHPVTLEVKNTDEQILNLVVALKEINKETIITYPNSDNGGDIIIKTLKEFSKKEKNVHLFKNLGSLKYLSLMKYCKVIVGNSSSAIVEGAYLKKAVVNIGNRQKGRLMADNIINVSNESKDIIKGIERALSKDFIENLENTKSLYGEGDTSKKIVEVLKSIDIDENLLNKKLIWSI